MYRETEVGVICLDIVSAHSRGVGEKEKLFAADVEFGKFPACSYELLVSIALLENLP